MSALRVRRIESIEFADLFLRGGIYTGRQEKAPIFGLHGLTITFTQPAAAVVTFSDPTNVGLTFLEIMTQIMAAVMGLSARYADGRLLLVETSPANGVNVDCSASTAANKLGFSSDGTSVGSVYNSPGGMAPALVQIASSAQRDAVIVVTEE